MWGDSTIASDGIIKDVRSRMQNRFGDGGPGVLAVQVDPRWALRRDILRKGSGWTTETLFMVALFQTDTALQEPTLKPAKKLPHNRWP